MREGAERGAGGGGSGEGALRVDLAAGSLDVSTDHTKRKSVSWGVWTQAQFSDCKTGHWAPSPVSRILWEVGGKWVSGSHRTF